MVNAWDRLCVGDKCSHMPQLSQAVPAAMSQVGRRHMRTRLNIASRAAESDSVYVSVLKIPIVLADGVSKWLRQNFFFLRERPLSARGKILYFATIMDTNRDSAH